MNFVTLLRNTGFKQTELSGTIDWIMLRLAHTQNRPRMATQPAPHMDEDILLRHIAEGDTSAFELFYKIYFPRLFRFILRMTHQPEFVEELIQETLLTV